MRGHLASFTPFDVLQYLNVSRRTGELRLRRADGEAAECKLVLGRIVGARCEHLHDREAVLTLVFWQAGEFEFEETPKPEEAGVDLSVEELTMEAVRIADELEMRAVDLPHADERLTLNSFRKPPADELECGVRRVADALRGRPATTRRQLECELDLCAIKVRLALTLLVRERVVCRVDAAAETPRRFSVAADDAELEATWSRVRRRFPTGLRVLVAFAPETAIGRFEPALEALGQRLGAPTRVGAVLPVGPSILRFRPPSGGILSVTLLPITRRDRYLYETFAPSVDIVIFYGWSSVAEIAEGWVEAVPVDADLEILNESCGLDAELSSALARCTEGLS